MKTQMPPRSRTMLFRAATYPLALALSVGLSACVDEPIAVEDPDPPTFSFYQFDITGIARFSSTASTWTRVGISMMEQFG